MGWSLYPDLADGSIFWWFRPQNASFLCQNVPKNSRKTYANMVIRVNFGPYHNQTFFHNGTSNNILFVFIDCTYYLIAKFHEIMYYKAWI